VKSEHEQRQEEMIDLMPIGDRMDALIAERVMGCDTITKGAGFYCCACSNKEHSIGDLTGDWNEEIKPYSTDIRAAWEIVEKLRTLGWNGGIRWEAGLHEAIAGLKNNPKSFSISRGETVPLAICRMALKAARFLTK
jgi:hypothetical protein